MGTAGQGGGHSLGAAESPESFPSGLCSRVAPSHLGSRGRLRALDLAGGGAEAPGKSEQLAKGAKGGAQACPGAAPAASVPPLCPGLGFEPPLPSGPPRPLRAWQLLME